MIPLNTLSQLSCYEPDAHSFHIISINHDNDYYYTCPAEARRYSDAEGLDDFIRFKLQNNVKPWIWIINSASFGFTHMKRVTVMKTILRLLQDTIARNLKQIIIVNQTVSFKMMMNTLWYLVPESIRKIIIFDSNNQFSRLLKLDEKLQILHNTLRY